MDLYSCDFTPGVDDWPGTFFGQPRFARSNHELQRSWAAGTFPPGDIVELDLGTAVPPCSGDNAVIYTTTPPGNGSWIQWGEAEDLGTNLPQFTFTMVGQPGTGSGSYDDPIGYPWERLAFLNEAKLDGVISGGFDNFQAYPLLGNTWYVGTFSLASVAGVTDLIFRSGFEF